MKLSRLIAITATIFLAVSTAGPSPAIAEPMQWGDPVSGVRLGIAIKPTGDSEFHPGEFVRLSVKVQPERKILLPGDIAYNLEYYTVVHVVTPDGHEAVWDPGFGMAVQGNLHHAQDWYKTADTASASSRLRLARGRAPWFDSTKDQPELSLRKSGKYRMWLEFRVSPDPKAPRGAWQHTAKSGEVEWHVAELPPADRLLTMTDEQKQLVEKWLASKHQLDLDMEKRMNNPLVKQILLAKNEGLAAKLLDVLKHDDSFDHMSDAWYMLCVRAGSTDDGDLGIDGPYLKELALWELDLVGGKLHWASPGTQKKDIATAQWNVLSSLQAMHGGGLVEQVLVYLTFHPEDRLVLDRLIKQCSLGGALGGSVTAWQVLIKLDMLKKGITLADAVKLLGTPSRENSDFAEWWWSNPALDAISVRPSRTVLYCKLKNGVVTSNFDIYHT